MIRGFFLVLAVCVAVSPGVSAWTPGTGSPTAAAGFVVDPMDRTDVLAFYNTVYTASENYAANMAWTGSFASGVAGTTSAAFKEDVRRRINFYRALSGLPGDITLDATKSAKDQEAALMFGRNNALSHTPPSSWIFYTANAYEAAGKSNIARGNYGPGAVNAYMRDDGAGNEFVGHRRWINYSCAQSMGTGDVPAQGSYSSSNALWVLTDFKAAPVPKFVAWPNRGYVPFNLVPARWSLSYPGANFAAATVTMTQGVTNIPTTIISSSTPFSYGDNTLVWTPGGLPASVVTDTPYHVTVSGISGSGVPTSYSYTVTLFDPSLLNLSPTIAGSDTPPATGAVYTFNSIAQADAYELRVASASAAAWNEGAEDPSSKIVAATTGSYSLRQSSRVRTGTKAFHLAFPDSSSQSFVIARDIIPSASSNLQFHELARSTTISNTLGAEISTDNGVSWTSIWSRSGVGWDNPNLWETAFTGHNISLAAYAGQRVRIRFILRNGGSYVAVTSTDYGFVIDDVTVTNASELLGEITTSLAGAATSFTLNAASAGAPLAAGTTYYLKIRPNVGTRWFADGASKVVTAQAPSGFAAWVTTQYPAVTGGPTADHDNDGLMNGVEYAFGLNPTAATPGSALPKPLIVGNNYTVTFPHPAGVTDVTYGAQWSPNLATWTPVTDTGGGGNHTFSVNKVGKGQVYFRYQIVVGP